MNLPILIASLIIVGAPASMEESKPASPLPRPIPPESPVDYTIQAETVTDNVTGLVWQRETPAERYRLKGAQDYCAKLELGGYKGWRLPTVEELLTIVDSGRSVPAINIEAFPNTPTEWFWSSTLLAKEADREADKEAAKPKDRKSVMAWGVSFRSGISYYDESAYGRRVRCVR